MKPIGLQWRLILKLVIRVKRSIKIKVRKSDSSSLIRIYLKLKIRVLNLSFKNSEIRNWMLKDEQNP